MSLNTRQYIIKNLLFVFTLFSFVGASKTPISLIEQDDSIVSNINIVDNEIIEQNTEEQEKFHLEMKLSKDLLQDEAPLMVAEFQDIVRLYNNSLYHSATRIKLYQRLLSRLNKMVVNTEFLMGQRDIMKNALRYRLGIKNKAIEELERIIQENSLIEIRQDAFHVLVSFLFVSGESDKLHYMIDRYQQHIHSEFLAYLQIVYKTMEKQATNEEISYLLDAIVLAPKTSFQQDSYTITLLNFIQEQLTVDEINQAINFSLYNENHSLALSLMRIQIKKTDVSYNTLKRWAENIGVFDKDLYKTVKLYQDKNSEYTEFVTKYQHTSQASARGRIYHRKLYAYRGMDKTPYNIVQTELILQEYLQNDIEQEYAEKNAERAFRNFLAYKRYDLVSKYAQEIRTKLDNEFRSPYVNFWESYALLKQGETNSVIPILGDIIIKDSESYYGILAQKKLIYIFKQIPFSSNKYFSSLKEKSANSTMDLINYANILYYLGNKSDKSYAEKVFVREGVVFTDVKTKISATKNCLLKNYIHLGLEDNARNLVYLDGIKTIYNQDLLFVKMYQDIDNHQNIMNIVSKRSDSSGLKNRYRMDREALKVYFPTPYQNHIEETLNRSKTEMDPYLLYSVMRTESFYKEKARSHAGAMGLMQIMPVTGKWLMDKYCPGTTTYSIYTPSINVYLGSVYLYDNIARIGMLPAVAAYNSGPTFVRNLEKKYLPATDLELVEIHPKQETRNYVKKVVESYKKYSFIYNNITSIDELML